MKKKFVKLTLFALLIGAGASTVVSCSNNVETVDDADQLKQTEEEEGEEVDTVSAVYNTPNGFNEAAANYLALKDVLVEGNGAEAQSKANDLLVSLEKVDASTIEEEGAQQWVNLSETLQNDASRIAGTADLADQRNTFTSLSNNMITAVETFGAEQTLYRQHCPMANNNAGGSWLSSSQQVRNPYYGEAMLKCGEVQAAIISK